MEKRQIDVGQHLLDLARTFGTAQDVEAVVAILSYAEKLGKPDGFFHALRLLGFFARLLNDMPERLRQMLLDHLAQHKSDLSQHSQAIGTIIATIPQQNATYLNSVVRSPAFLGLVTSAVQQTMNANQALMTRQASALGSTEKQLKETCEQTWANQAANESLLRRMKGWMLILLCAWTVITGWYVWKWQLERRLTRAQLIERSFRSFQVDTHVEESRDGVFVRFEVDQSLGKGFIVRRVSEKCVSVGFVDTNAYPPDAIMH